MSQELGDSATKHGFRPRCHPEISAKKKQSSELRIPWNPRRIQNSKSPSKNGKGPTFGASSGKCVFFKNNKKPSLDIPGTSTPRDLFHVVFLVRISSHGDQIFEMCLPAIASVPEILTFCFCPDLVVFFIFFYGWEFAKSGYQSNMFSEIHK